jgi:DNA repair protein RecO (recombination protein O)
MVEHVTGLVLRTRPLSETSLIVHWLTPTLGRVATVAKGAQRPKSPFRGKLDLFYYADFSFRRSRKSELHALREVSLRGTHPALRRDLGYLRQASYCARVIEQTTETETPLPMVYELMLGLLEHLPSGPPQPQTVLAFELKLLRELGFEPNLERSRLSAGSREIIKALDKTAWSENRRLKLSDQQITEIRQFLHGFMIYHLGRIPKGRERALDLSSMELSEASPSR